MSIKDNKMLSVERTMSVNDSEMWSLRRMMSSLRHERYQILIANAAAGFVKSLQSHAQNKTLINDASQSQH